jgi:hypothetical protein
MKTRTSNLFSGAALCCAMSLGFSSHAGVVALNFVLPDNTYYENILNYYNAGADQNGATGPNDGVTFSSGAMAFLNYPATQDGFMSNVGFEPHGGDSMIFTSGNVEYMNVPGGFTTGFSFYYSCLYQPGSVNLYSGPNGTGTVLATIPLHLTPDGVLPPFFLPVDYSVWQPVDLTFAGTAESVSFVGSVNYTAFSDITLGQSTPAGVPDNGGSSLYALAGLALAAGALRPRQKLATV